jgi:hypothetical protein
MKKHLLVWITLIVSISGWAQSFTPVPGLQLTIPSANGKWACSFIPENDGITAGVVYLYDVEQKVLHHYESELGKPPYADAVSDNGIAVGSIGGKAAFMQAGEWTLLPVPEDSRIFETFARGISSDGSIICGFLDINLDSGADIPILWTRQTDGSYEYELLPAPEKDYAGKTPQAVNPLLVSADGHVIAGRIVDWSGFNNLLIVWKKNADNAWEYQILGEDIIFTGGQENGATLSVYYMTISGNGRYLICSVACPDPNNPDAYFHSPMYFDLQTGEHTIFAFAKDAMAYGMTDAGDLFYATPYLGHTKNTYVIPAGTGDSSIALADWILEQTDNQLDIRPNLQSQGYTTGRAIPSADGKILISTFDSPIDNVHFSYVVDLEETTAIHSITPSSFTEAVEHLTIMDVSGRILFDGEPARYSEILFNYPHGIYIVKELTNKSAYTHKLAW